MVMARSAASLEISTFFSISTTKALTASRADGANDAWLQSWRLGADGVKQPIQGSFPSHWWLEETMKGFFGLHDELPDKIGALNQSAEPFAPESLWEEAVCFILCDAM